jgi:predicted kinase
MSKVILTVGPPGVGKTTWIKNYVANINEPYVICSADHYFEKEGKYVYEPSKIGLAHNSCFEKFVNALRSEIPLIFIDNTNVIKEQRAKYINKANEYGYEVEVKVFPVDINRIKLQNKSQERIDANKIIPDSVIDRMSSKLDLDPGTWKLVNGKLVKILETKQFIRVSEIQEMAATPPPPTTAELNPPAQTQQVSSSMPSWIQQPDSATTIGFAGKEASNAMGDKGLQRQVATKNAISGLTNRIASKLTANNRKFDANQLSSWISSNASTNQFYTAQDGTTYALASVQYSSLVTFLRQLSPTQ